MPLAILGLIVIIAAYLLYRDNRGDGRRTLRSSWSGVDPAAPKPKREYRKSTDGKVVYLFGQDGKDAPQAAPQPEAQQKQEGKPEGTEDS